MENLHTLERAVADIVTATEIRHATAGDRDLFMTLWREFALDIQGNGYELRWTPRTESFFCTLFDAYVSESLDGVVLLAGTDGALIWGEIGKEPLFDTSFGRIANGFGTYLRRSLRGLGLSTRMREIAAARLSEMGFDCVLGAARHENRAGYESSLSFGFVEHSVTGVLRLGRE